MYARHFFKMLLGLLGMALIGVVGLAISDYYSQHGAVQAKAGAAYAGSAVILEPASDQ